MLIAKASGFDVTDMTNVPGSQPSRNLMVSGQADLAFEYTGTAWLAYLGHEGGIPDKQKQWQAVHDADLANGLTWGQPAPLNNTYAFAVGRNSQNSTTSLSFLILPLFQWRSALCAWNRNLTPALMA